MAGASIVDLPPFFHKKTIKPRQIHHISYWLWDCLVVFWCFFLRHDNQPTPQRRPVVQTPKDVLDADLSGVLEFEEMILSEWKLVTCGVGRMCYPLHQCGFFRRTKTVKVWNIVPWCTMYVWNHVYSLSFFMWNTFDIVNSCTFFSEVFYVIVFWIKSWSLVLMIIRWLMEGCGWCSRATSS